MRRLWMKHWQEFTQDCALPHSRHVLSRPLRTAARVARRNRDTRSLSNRVACLVAVVVVAVTLGAAPSRAEVFNQASFAQIGTANSDGVGTRAYVHTDGYAYLLFQSRGPFDDYGYEFDRMNDLPHCYVTKLNGTLDRQWTRSLRHTSDDSNPMNHAMGLCFPLHIGPVSGDSTKLQLYYMYQLATSTVTFVRKQILVGTGNSVSVENKWTVIAGQQIHNVFEGYYTGWSWTGQQYGGFNMMVPLSDPNLFVFTGYRWKNDASLHAAIARFNGAQQCAMPTITDVQPNVIVTSSDVVYIYKTGMFVVMDSDCVVSNSYSWYSAGQLNSISSLSQLPAYLIEDEMGPGQHTLYLAFGLTACDRPMGIQGGRINSLGQQDIFLLRATVNATSAVGVWIKRFGGTLIDTPAESRDAITAHPQHGIFVVGHSRSDLGVYSNNGNRDALIVWFDTSGKVVDYFLGGTSGDDIAYGIYFNPLTGYPPLIVGTSKGDMDRSGPSEYKGEQDMWYGFANFTLGCGIGSYRTGVPMCTLCAAGYYAESPDLLLCTLCPAGHETGVAAGASTCTKCAPGTYATTSGTSVCPPCAIGYSAIGAGSESCTICGTGTYASSTGSATCSRCEVATYNDQLGSKNCTSCPNGSTTLSDATAELRYCECDKGMYGNPTGAFSGDIVECKTCPSKTECLRGQQFPHPVPGYWNTASDPVTILACSPTSSCIGGAVSACADGYTGTACNECASSYYRASGGKAECTKCPDLTVLTIVLVVSVVVFIVAVGCCIGTFLVGTAYYFRKIIKKMTLVRRVAYIVRQVSQLKYAIKYVQLSSIILSMDLPWGGMIVSVAYNINGIAKLINPASFIQIDCLSGLSAWKGVLQIFFISMILVSTGVIVLSFTLCQICLHRGRLKTFLSSSVSSTFVLMNTLYITVHSLTLQIFSCFEQGPNVYRLVIDPSIQCFHAGAWLSLAVPASILFLVISVGYPVLVMTLIYMRKTRLGKTEAYIQNTKSIFAPYLDKYYWFESVAMTERFLLPFSSVLVILRNEIQILYTLSVVLLFVEIYFKCEAVKSYLEYIWEVTVGIALVYTALVAGLVRVDDSSSSAPGTSTANSILTGVYLLSVSTMLAMCITTVVNALSCGDLEKRLERRFRHNNSTGQAKILAGNDNLDPLKENNPLKEKNPFEEVGTSASDDDSVSKPMLLMHGLPVASLLSSKAVTVAPGPAAPQSGHQGPDSSSFAKRAGKGPQVDGPARSVETTTAKAPVVASGQRAPSPPHGGTTNDGLGALGQPSEVDADTSSPPSPIKKAPPPLKIF